MPSDAAIRTTPKNRAAPRDPGTRAGWALKIAAIAGLLEITWVLSVKASGGFARADFTVFAIAIAWLSFWLLGLSMRVLPAGTAYAVWTGIGAVGVAVFGVLLFHEPLTFAGMACIGLIVAGILGSSRSRRRPYERVPCASHSRTSSVQQRTGSSAASWVTSTPPRSSPISVVTKVPQTFGRSAAMS